MDSQLFQLQDSLRLKKRKVKKEMKPAKPRDTVSLSMGFYDDLGPITVTKNSDSFDLSASFSLPETETFDENSAPSFTEPRFSVQELSEFIDPGNGDEQPASFSQYVDYAEPVPEPTEKSNPFYTGLSEETIAADLSAINSGLTIENKVAEEKRKAEEKEDYFRNLLERNKQEGKKPEAESPSQDAVSPNSNASQQIFDAIAKSMNYANAFDLGDYVLEQRFDLFDEEENKKLRDEKGGSAVPDLPAGNEMSLQDTEYQTRNFIEDLDMIRETAKSLATVPAEKANWPPVPVNLVQPSVARTKQLFGEFEFAPIPDSTNCEVTIKGNWEAENIVPVEIPQLLGIINGTTQKPITKTVMRFNKKSQKQLQRLWKAWEDAKLTDRILTFDGGFVPRFKKKKGGVCGTSLSNHAWGTAFDINAQWNGMNQEPALVGEKGSVRELVDIANKHGFYWGGHFSNKDGMHFEVAETDGYND